LVGSTVGAVSATTLRSGVTRLVYDVVGGNVDERFTVDSTSGQLRVGRPLREYWRRPTTLELWVESRDDGRPALFSVTPVTVTILPVNSVAPRFIADLYNATVIEEAPAPVVVVTVTAVDHDVGEAGRITYSLRVLGSNTSSPFSIDERTGRIQTTARIDRENVAKYQLVVYASDHVSTTDVK